MKMDPRMAAYLRRIEREMSDIEGDLKRSIMVEIEDYLHEKAAERLRKTGGRKLTREEMDELLYEFGDPPEVAEAYRQQIDETGSLSRTNRYSLRNYLITVSVIIVSGALVLAGLYLLREPQGEEDEDDIIYMGKGLNRISVGDTADDVQDEFGTPDSTVEGEGTIWMNYRVKTGIDFLILSATGKVVEMRFNEGFQGSLENGIEIGSTLELVLGKMGGAKMTVGANRTATHANLYGSDRVLYQQLDPDGNITAYKFIDEGEGVLFWCDENGVTIQIVVFEPI